jgi:hypothetical protein
MRSTRAFVLSLLISATPAYAYYHYVHYNAAGAAIKQKFDLTTLPNGTVSYFVTNSGPTIYPQNDSFSSVLSQVNQAISVWNSVGTSGIRLAFSGLFNPSSPLPNTPGGQVEFVQLPPGYYGMGGPTVSTTISANAQFIPILRSTVYLTTDLTQAPGPSYSSTFFLTTVHEIGHSLGLQHTYTSSAMSTASTRATSLTRPIDADDIAGLSVLYPANGFTAQTGSISGRVTANGTGVHMASVVAIRSGYGAVSELTNPDGTFQIDGVPPGSYYLYAHPLPSGTTSSCLDICAPIDVNGNAVAPSAPFNTVFLGGSTSFQNSNVVLVQAGQVSTGANFSVTPRANVPISNVTVYTYYGSNFVSPGFLNMSSLNYGGILAGGTGLTASGKVVTGLTAQIMGGAASVYSVTPYTNANSITYLNMGVEFSLGAPVGQQHLIFTSGNFVYVLPSAVNLVSTAPPTVTAAVPNVDGSVSISGTNFGADSLIYFDGLPAIIRNMNPQAGQATVVPPPGASGQQSTIVVYNHDGQNSLFVQGNSTVTYSYPAAPTPSISIAPNSLPAGSEALVTITGTNTAFTQGQTIAGFGSSDVYVRNVIVQSPTQLLVDLSIPPGAVNAALEASVIAGFQISSLPNAFQITPPAATPIPAVIPALQNATPGQTGAYPGAAVSFTGSNLVAGTASPSVTINGNPVPVLAASSSAVTILLPSNLSQGAAILGVNNGTASSFPVAVSISALPATITSVQNAANIAVTPSAPIAGGNVVNVYLSGFASQTAVIAPSEVTVNVGGINHPAIEIAPAGSGLFLVRFVLSNLVPTGTQTPVIVYLDGNSSYTAYIATLNN